MVDDNHIKKKERETKRKNRIVELKCIVVVLESVCVQVDTRQRCDVELKTKKNLNNIRN